MPHRSQAPPKGRPLDPIDHGSRRGYNQHLRRGEEPCEVCRAAENEYQKERQAIRRAEGRMKERPYTPKVPRLQVYLDPALVDSFLRGRDEEILRELRAELREGLEQAKDRYGDDLVARARAARA